MMDKLRNWNRKNQKNYVEIFIKSDLKKIIKAKRKKLYHKKISKIVGIDIKPQFPKKPHIKIVNNFDKDINFLAKEVIRKINNLLY